MPVARCIECNYWISNKSTTYNKLCYSCTVKEEKNEIYDNDIVIAAKALLSLKKIKLK